MVTVLADELTHALHFPVLLPPHSLQQLSLALLQDPAQPIKALTQMLLLPPAVVLRGKREAEWGAGWGHSRAAHPPCHAAGLGACAPGFSACSGSPRSLCPTQDPESAWILHPRVPTSMAWQISSICVTMAWIRSFPATSIAIPSLSSLCHAGIVWG